MSPLTQAAKLRAPTAFLLDAQRVQSFLAHHAAVDWPDGAVPQDVHIERAWPAEAGKLAVEWSFQLADRGRFSLFATPACPDDRPDREEREPRIAAGILQGVRVELAGEAAVLHSVDHDPELSWLPQCMDASVIPDHLAPYWANGDARGTGVAVDVRVLSYRARRRATLAYHRDGMKLIGKTFRDRRGEQSIAWHRHLKDSLSSATAGRVTVAEPIGCVPTLHMALFSWFADAAARSTFDASPENLGRAMQALAALHRTPVPHLPAFSHDGEIAVVGRWQSTLAGAERQTTAWLDRLIPAWRSQTARPSDPATIHRDFYGRQVLLGRECVMLLDLDTLSRGDPAIDVGNTLAHLWLDAMQHAGGTAAGVFERQAGGVVGAYRKAGGLLGRDSLRWFWTAALLRLGAIHTLRTTTGPFAAGLLGLAARLLETTVTDDESPAAAANRSMRLPDPALIMRNAEG